MCRFYIVYMKTVYSGVRVYVSSKIFHGSENIKILKELGRTQQTFLVFQDILKTSSP